MLFAGKQKSYSGMANARALLSRTQYLRLYPLAILATRPYSTFPEQEEAEKENRKKATNKVGPKLFNPMKSKYGSERESRNLAI